MNCQRCISDAEGGAAVDVALALYDDAGDRARSSAGEFARACGWADDIALALVSYDRTGLDQQAAAGLTLQIRDALTGA